MNNLKSIIKFELIRYFYSPLAAVYLISFLLLSGASAIYFGHFFADGYAGLTDLFVFQPWIYLLFIPAIAMRSWSEEFKSKSIVQILTTPTSVVCLVWGKFFAAWIFIALSIALTFPFWITVNLLGSPDNMVILVSYLSCFILAGAILALSQTMSALTKNPVIALVLAVFVNLLFFWSGFEYVLFWARTFLNDVFVDTIASFSFLTHFDAFSRGLVELRDIVYFASLILFCNLTTIVIVSLKTKGTGGLISSSSFKHCSAVLVLLFIGFLGINIIANNLLRQINYDFTEEKYLSLTQNTKDILRKLNRPVVAKLYYSPILAQRNPEIRQTFEQVKLLLKQYKSFSRGKFDYKIYQPEFLDKNEDRALAEGLQPIPLIDINQTALFGISFSDTLGHTSVIPFFSTERLPFLEQDLTTNIYKLQHQKKKLGVLSTLPVFGAVRPNDVSFNRWEIINVLSELYDVTPIRSLEDLDKDFDVLMLIHPHHLEADVVEKIKKHKKVLVLLDVADNASLLYSPAGGEFLSSDLGDLASYWEIDFYSGNVVADFDNSITVDDTVDYAKNPSFTQDLLQFKTTQSDFNPNHRTTYKLNNILFSSASFLAPKAGGQVLFFPLIKASYNSGVMDASFAKKNKKPEEILENFEPLNTPIILAAEFLSDNPAQGFDVIAIADTDFIYDNFWAKKQTFMEKTYFIPLFDNVNFVLNSLDYLTKNDDLISLRGKTIKPRPFYRIENMRKRNLYSYKIKEAEIFNAINSVKQQLTEVIAKKNFEERDNFTPDELAVIGKIRQDIGDLRQQLSTLRTTTNRNIEKIDLQVKFWNVYFIPLLILLGLLFLNIKYSTHSLSAFFKYAVPDKKILKLSWWILLISLLAGLSIYWDNKSSISEYEDVSVFPNFDKEINNVSQITLQSATEKLIFKRQNGAWILEDHNLPVYQERILKFLAVLKNMTFYEKKSDKAEDMKYFGFSPLADKKSPTVEVTLADENYHILEKFDIGFYDIPLGRGSKGAFIRLNNRFQVWLAEADFYDLSLDPTTWTYSTLWNLRFGRFISYNDVTDDLSVMTLVKNLLNTQIQTISKNIDNTEEYGKITVEAENNNKFSLVFYKTSDNKYFAKFEFLTIPTGNHLVFFEKYIKNSYLEISKTSWEKLHNDIVKK
jgi:ABC-2 type transport system permease protein